MAWGLATGKTMATTTGAKRRRAAKAARSIKSNNLRH